MPGQVRDDDQLAVYELEAPAASVDWEGLQDTGPSTQCAIIATHQRGAAHTGPQGQG